MSDEKLLYRCARHSSKLMREHLDDPRYAQWQINKVKNLQLAIPHINAVLIPPGKIFSFCKRVGRPTQKKGYLEGMELSRGRAQPGIGGGLCQLSNLLNWLAWHTPLHVIDRSHHSFDPFPDSNRVLPFGSGAALFWNYVDLQIYNPTNETFQISVWIDEDTLKGEVRCSKAPAHEYHVFEKNHFFTKRDDQWFRSNEIWRNVYEKGTHGKPQNLIGEEFLVKNFSRVCYEPDLALYECR
ncbi:MAG: VanW family protein [Pseudomonadota bacterium]